MTISFLVHKFAKVLLFQTQEGEISTVAFRHPKTGYTALHWACYRGSAECVEVMKRYRLSLGLRIGAKDNKGYTPLHVLAGNCVTKGHLRACGCLYEKNGECEYVRSARAHSAAHRGFREKQ